MSQTEEKLNALGITLPAPPQPQGFYRPAVRCGNLLFVSGQLPISNGMPITGKVDGDVSFDDARQAARLSAINILSVIKAELGDLDKIKQILRVQGFVNSSPGFTKQPQVLNGASELLAEALGERGHHARVAVGAAELPLNAVVEVELIAEIE